MRIKYLSVCTLLFGLLMLSSCTAGTGTAAGPLQTGENAVESTDKPLQTATVMQQSESETSQSQTLAAATENQTATQSTQPDPATGTAIGAATTGSPLEQTAEKQYDDTLTGKYVCLTFDDGPAGNNTPKVLKTLKKYGIKGTFFTCGPDTPEERKMIRQEHEEGHAVGIHCYSHKLQSLYKSAESFTADFDRMEKIVEEETGEKPVLYRFPGGSNNHILKNDLYKIIVEKLKSRGYEFYDWNASGMDDSRPAAEVVMKNAVAQCKSRAKAKTPTILLLHDSAGRYTSADALPGIIERLQAAGFQFIPLSDAVKPAQFKRK